MVVYASEIKMVSVPGWLPTLTELRVDLYPYWTQWADDVKAPTTGRVDTTADPEVLDLVTDRFSSIDDTYDRLTDLETYLRTRDDRRAVFLTVYTEMTAAVRRGIDTGRFAKPDWVSEYIVTFANYYRDALCTFELERYRDVPLPWRIAFRASGSGDTLVLQDALLGINAHINYDLAFTVYDVGIDADRSTKRADHAQINSIVEQVIDTVQVALASVYAGQHISSLDVLLDRFDEQIALLCLTEGRSFAWQNAVLLEDTSWQWITEAVHWRLRTFSSGAGYVILSLDVGEPLLGELESYERPNPPLSEFETEFRRHLP